MVTELFAWAGMFFSGLCVFAVVRYGAMALIRHDVKRRRITAPPRPPAVMRPEPVEITALRDQVMGPIEDVIADGERKAQEEWDREHPPVKQERAVPEQAAIDAAVRKIAGLEAENKRLLSLQPGGDIAADDVHVLRIERAQLMAELERMAWDQGIPRSNRRFSALMRQLGQIDRQISKAVAAGQLRAEEPRP
jgi:hypothetical protein